MTSITTINDFHREQREQREQSNDDTTALKRPSFICHLHSFRANDDNFKTGLYYHSIRHDKDNKAHTHDIWICAPIKIGAITRSQNNDNFGRLICFMDVHEEWREWAMPMHLLKNSGDELLGELLNLGFVFDRKYRSLLIDFIMSEHPQKTITATTKVGWHDDVFVLPNTTIGETEIVFQSENAAEHDFEMTGTLKDWNDHIGALCEGNPSLIVSVSAALAGALLHRINRKTGGGIHWVGDSSIGKSTILEVAASVWGSSDFIRSWSVTSNGLEGIAAMRNDTCLILDEINEASPHEIGKIAYIITNGMGKQRAGRAGNARKIQRWRVSAISSGEKTLETVMQQAGLQTNTGQLVRILNIPAAFSNGAFDKLHEFNNGKEFAEHLKSACQRYYGSLGIAFIRTLINDQQDISQLLSKIEFDLLTHAKNNLERRAASFFAIIALAGELAIQYGLIPWHPGCAHNATLSVYQRWQKFQCESHTEDSQILDAVVNFITKYSDSRFSSLLHQINDKHVTNRAGWHKETNGKRIYMFTKNALLEAVKGFDRSRIVDSLSRFQWIVEKDTNRLTKKTRTPAGSLNLYYIAIPESEEASPL